MQKMMGVERSEKLNVMGCYSWQYRTILFRKVIILGVGAKGVILLSYKLVLREQTAVKTDARGRQTRLGVKVIKTFFDPR